MKSITVNTRFIVILALSFFSNVELQSQNITLQTQAQVNSFNPLTTIINGDLYIGYPQGQNTSTDITDLSNLENLLRISGKLSFVDNPNLQSLEGLHNLDSIGAFTFNDNDLIDNFSELVSLEHIGSDIFIGGNGGLTDISHLPIPEVFQGKLSIGSNSNLTVLPALDHVIEIGGISITALPITTLNIFDNLEVIHGELKISSLSNISEINGFSNLKTLNGKLSISSCSTIESLGSFNNLETISEGFRIYSCQDLLGISGFTMLSEVGGDFEMSFNYDLV
jgi:hypothetical protein